MRKISDVYLTNNSPEPNVIFDMASKSPIDGDLGVPIAKKSTPTTPRITRSELELTYTHNPIIFNGINKIVQTIMSAKHVLVAKDKKVQSYFRDYLSNLGNSGSDVTWEELLSQIYKFQCIYGTAYIENIFNKKGNRIVDWDMIDPKKMDYAKDGSNYIVLDKFGRPIGYVETLPSSISIMDNNLPKEFADKVILPANSIFMEAKEVAQLKMFMVGDGFYPLGLIEPIYKTSLRKLNIEGALANSIWRHGFPIMLSQVGDANHEPSPGQVQTILNKIRDINFKQELAVPYYVDLKMIESSNVGRLRQQLEYFIDQEVAGLGIPKPFVTGGGEATNRATLGNQQGMFQLTLRDIIDKTVENIRKYMFKPICDLEGFSEVPNLIWNVIGNEELANKSSRIVNYVKEGIFTPDQIREMIINMEGMTDDISGDVPVKEVKE